MDFQLTEEQAMLQQTAREFADREIAPKAAEFDKQARWPVEIVKQMADLGFLGMMVPTEYGGSGLDAISYVLAMEEVSRGCASCGVIMSVNNSLFCDPVLKFGTEKQKQEILSVCASGEKLGCFGLTEPMSGSDAQTMQTVAEKKGDKWLMNGSKNFITNGPHADYINVFADTDKSGPKVKHTAIIVPMNAPG
ncbi:MAG: acyl-CoA dehydrogenase family protein, partial [Polyangiaceae bacterium]